MKVISLHTDLQLLQEMQKGNEKAMRLLFERYYVALCRFAYQYLKDKDLAEEVVADVFMHLWQKRNKLSITKSIKAYLYKCVIHKSLNEIRKNKIEFTKDELDIDKAHYTTPEYQMIDAENQVGIEKMLGILSEPVKVVFLLHREDGFSYKEIAELLQISVKTVEAHMGKALKLLRENLKNTSFDMLIKS